MQITEVLAVNETTIPNLVFTKILLADNRLVIKVTHGEDSQLTQPAGGMARFLLDSQTVAPRDLTPEELAEIAKNTQIEDENLKKEPDTSTHEPSGNIIGEV
jgi:hypothetical protein